MSMDVIAQIARAAGLRAGGLSAPAHPLHHVEQLAKQAGFMSSFLGGAGRGLTGVGAFMPWRGGATPVRTALGQLSGRATGLAGLGAGVYGAGHALTPPDLAGDYVTNANKYNQMKSQYKGKIDEFEKDPNAGAPSGVLAWMGKPWGSSLWGQQGESSHADQRAKMLAQMKQKLESGQFGENEGLPGDFQLPNFSPWGQQNAAKYKQLADQAANNIRMNRQYTGSGVLNKYPNRDAFNKHLDDLIKTHGLDDPRTSPQGAKPAAEPGSENYGNYYPGRPGGQVDYNTTRAGRGIDWRALSQQ